ncbi:MAG: HAMP domain-containing histidine kinase [Candidatus Liptonbacteria bacterium]|nr:HAMP domain-containing histidine kinase [Candidatus Liptonbacteria bacterium]
MDIQQRKTEQAAPPAESRLKLVWLGCVPLAVAIVIGGFFLPIFLLLAQAVLLVGAALIMARGVGEGGASAAPAAQEFSPNAFRMVLERLGDALFVYDKDFKVTFWNPAAERVFSLPSAEVLGRALTPQDAENPRRRLLAQVAFPSLAPGMVARSEAGAYPQVTDLSFTDPFLELRVTSLSLGADVAGMPLGFAKVIRDRTREMSLMKSKNEFVTIASHQLRTPVTGLHWALESLRKTEGLDATTKMLVDGSFTQSEILLRIIDDLLGIAKIEEGRFGYAFASTDLVEFLNKILGQIFPIAQHASVSLYFDKPAEKLPPVIADPQKLAMVVSNLVENAIRYNVKNGSVTVGLKHAAEGPFVEVTVKDTGIGISPEDVKRLFTKFFRAENAVKLQTEGSGLGLYIVRNIIQAHGGTIWAESERERGTTFHFTLATDPNRVPRHEVPLG